MGIKEFFKKIFAEKKQEKIEEIRKKIKFSEISNELDKLIRQNNEKRADIKLKVIKRTKEFDNELEEQVKVLEQITLEKRKESEKLKKIVLENLFIYIRHLKSLIIDLRNSKDNKEHIERVNQILKNHNKLSRPFYEKATILIGNELGKIREIIHKFVSDINFISQPYYSISDKEIDFMKDLLAKLEDTKKNKENFNKRIIELRAKIKELKIELSSSKGDLENFKDSAEYQAYLEEVKEKQQEKEELNNQINEIKRRIDLKALAKYSHGNEKRSRLIKEYRDNFYSALEKDRDFEIINISREVGVNINDLERVWEKLKELKIKTDSEENIKAQEDKINRIKNEILDCENEIIINSEKCEKVKHREEGIRNEITSLASCLGFDVD